jgi:putative restriction endonuclease
MAKLFGEVPGNPIGSTFASRPALSQARVHRPRMGGISGNGREGADSIVVSGGYIDDQDFRDELIYTGHGGNDPATKRQIADQELDAPGNAGLARSQLDGLPVRVIRGAGGDPAYSPPFGFRYDGLFRVTNHWSKKRQHEPPRIDGAALGQCPATRGFVVGAVPGFLEWHARGQGFKSPQLHQP